MSTSQPSDPAVITDAQARAIALHWIGDRLYPRALREFADTGATTDFWDAHDGEALMNALAALIRKNKQALELRALFDYVRATGFREAVPGWDGTPVPEKAPKAKVKVPRARRASKVTESAS